MASAETYFTPQAPVRWANLITARTQLDESKLRAWTCQLLLSPFTNPKHAAFLEKLESILTDTHGTKKRISDKGKPWKQDAKDPSITVVKFKTLEFVNDDGSKAKSPQIIDAKRNAWNGAAIGNDSELIIKFFAAGWEGPEGVGLSLRPRAAQVLVYVPRKEEDATDGFEEQDGFNVADSTGYVDEFAGQEEEAPF